MLNLLPIDRVRERLANETGPDQMETAPDATFAFYSNNLINFDGLIASLSRRQFQQLLFRSIVHLDLEHRKIGFEIPCPFLRRLGCPCLSNHRLQTHGTGQW